VPAAQNSGSRAQSMSVAVQAPSSPRTWMGVDAARWSALMRRVVLVIPSGL
jgi:hypothetical protein